MRRLALLLAVAAICSATAAFGQVANNGGAVCVQSSIQSNSKCAPDGVGGVFVVWQDYRRGEWDVYAQHLDASGLPTWAYGGIPICTGPGHQTNVSVIPDGQGGMIAVWEDARAGADIYTQRVSASGMYLWAFNGVVASAGSSTQNMPVPVTDGAGGVIIAWQDYRAGGPFVYVQRIAASGTPLWTLDGVRICSASGTQQFPVSVPDSSGGAIVVWQDGRTGGQDIYGQRVNSGGSTQWTSNGVPVCSASGEQTAPVVTTDAVGGVIVAWQDQRAGSSIHTQRLNGTGVTLWSTDGVALVAATGASLPTIASDGSNGAIVTWQDQRSTTQAMDLYAQRIGSAGVPLWTGNGVVVCDAIAAQYGLSEASDGNGGVIVSWYDSRTSSNEVYAQRIDMNGARQWFGDGVQLTAVSASNQWYPFTASDGSGGAFVLWQDDRYTTGPDVFIQHLSGAGALRIADAEAPRIAAVRDVPNDQGGRVKVSWTASIQDLSPFYRVSEYRIWRSVPDRAWVANAGATQSFAAGTSARRQTKLGSTTYYWELIGTQSSGHFYNYSLVAPTTSDSMAGSNPRTTFMIEARTATGDLWWDSDPDSGYSVDNLAPGSPAGLYAVLDPASGGTALHWLPNTEGDLGQYVIYAGRIADFTPSPWNQVAAVADTGYVDAARAHAYYKVAARDVHGNESVTVPAHQTTVAGVDHGTRPRLWLGSASPNPFGLEGTSIRFGLARTGRVQLAVFDLGGRRIANLVDRTLEEGDHEVNWNGRVSGGSQVDAGLYFYRLLVDGRALSARVVRMR